MSNQNDAEFYVGYLGAAPQGIASWRRGAVRLLFGIGLLLLAMLLLGMRPFSRAVFEFGVEREFVGELRERPVPRLVVQHPNADSASSYLLVSFGKHGAHEQTAGLDGQRVKLKGSLIFREQRTMIELLEGSIEVAGPATAAPELQRDRGELTLVGEIVDSKCFLGVMKPGNLKPHRACATRCIAGGVPPILMVRVSADEARSYLLVDQRGGALNAFVLDRIAEPVRVQGRHIQRGDLDFLYADPADIERWSPAEE